MKRNIVLLHGWGANIQKLQSLADGLKRLTWNVLVPEIPGFDAPEPETVWGVGEYAEYVSLWAKKAFKNQQYIVLGHSFGGRIGIKIATTPDTLCEGLVLCATGGLSRGNVVKRATFLTLAKIGKVFLLIPIPGLGEGWRVLVYKLAREHDYEKASAKMKKVFKRTVAEDLKPFVSKISIPTLVVWGKADRVTPFRDAEFLMKNLKHGTLTSFEDQGHRLPYEKPAEVADAIEQWIKNY